MPLDAKRGHAALRRGRWSQTGADYFLTFCTVDRKPGLHKPPVIDAIWRECEHLEAEKIWSLRTGVVMPDHVHLLIELGPTSDLRGSVRFFKGRLSVALRRSGLQWQPAYFDHRLRAEDDRLPVFLYVFLNPYRANLVSTNAVWPGYRCSATDWDWFEPLTRESRPFPEWLA